MVLFTTRRFVKPLWESWVRRSLLIFRFPPSSSSLWRLLGHKKQLVLTLQAENSFVVSEAMFSKFCTFVLPYCLFATILFLVQSLRVVLSFLYSYTSLVPAYFKPLFCSWEVWHHEIYSWPSPSHEDYFSTTEVFLIRRMETEFVYRYFRYWPKHYNSLHPDYISSETILHKSRLSTHQICSWLVFLPILVDYQVSSSHSYSYVFCSQK